MANGDPVYISINNTAQAVLEAMDGLEQQRAVHQAAHGRRRRVPGLLFLAGLPFIGLDFLMGYNYLTGTLIAAGLWGAAFVTARALARARPGAAFPPAFKTAREVLFTLRDDPAPDRPIFGHLDLSGPQQPAKRFREGKNARGQAVEFFRDEWLSLKAKLIDGNMLRVSAIERVKVRKGFYRTSRISGKSKFKPPKLAYAHQLKVRLSVNPEVYEIAERGDFKPGTRVGAAVFTQVESAGGILEVTAGSASSRLGANDILSVMRLVYDQLERKA
jgi:hypothetical protein